MKQNLTRKPVISKVFSVTGIIPAWLGKTGITGLIFSRGECFLRYWVNNLMIFKGELGELEFYLRKISLHQQKFLVVSVFSNSPRFPRNLKNGPKWSYWALFSQQHFSPSKDARSNFLYLLRDDMS